MPNFPGHRPIAHYEDRYHILLDGQVKNLATNKMLTPIKNNNGYYKVSLADGKGGHKQLSIHRLVAEHFLPNPYKYTQINHKNGNKADNRWFNLEWCTAQHNIHHAFKAGLRPGYMSASDKELYLKQVLNGISVNTIAMKIARRPETLHKMLRETAKRIGCYEQWLSVMKENRRNAAIRNLTKIGNKNSKNIKIYD